MSKEWLARGVIVLGLVLVLSLPALYRQQPGSGIELHAHMPEAGGWTPATLTVGVGEPLHLRLISDDVMHGFAVGQLDQPAVDVKPGEVTEITLQFTKPGKYTFYCTRWCGVNHWRMRGTIEVTGTQVNPISNNKPLYISLGIDIDATHQAAVLPPRTPSAWHGAMLSTRLPEVFRSHDYYLSHSPLEVYQALRSESAIHDLTNQDVWDLVAWVFRSNASDEEVMTGKQLYSSNCSACHGVDGAGDGVFADQLKASLADTVSAMGMDEHLGHPADFTDPNHMLAISPAHLQGKIIRGGMGTGMPSWGPIFTQDQTWQLVAYLWSFQFPLEDNP